MSERVTVDAVSDLFGRHVQMYAYRQPHYQTEMLLSLQQLWLGHHRSVLDVGGGTGLLAEALLKFMPVDAVTAIDIVDRFLPNLSVKTEVYDGKVLPYDKGAFNGATINNVVHHIPVEARLSVFKELRRVVDGPLYIKDHISAGMLDDWRLTILDILGNVPFGGMIKAQYLPLSEWESLAADAGYKLGQKMTGQYRTGVMAALFPNRLEVSLRFDPV